VESALLNTKTPAAVVKYIWQAVLTPRMAYPLTVVNVERPASTIDALERAAHRWLLQRIGLHKSFSKALLGADLLLGGLGLEPWTSRIGRSRAELANSLSRHHEADYRRLLWHLQDAEAADRLGTLRGWWANSVDLWKHAGMNATFWTNLGGARVNDVPLTTLIAETERSMEPSLVAAWLVQRNKAKWGAASSITWLSDAVDDSGTYLRPIWLLPEYRWTERLFTRLKLKHRLVGFDNRLLSDCQLGAYFRADAQTCPSQKSMELEAIHATTPAAGILRTKSLAAGGTAAFSLAALTRLGLSRSSPAARSNG
jgi:hypothetical protein